MDGIWFGLLDENLDGAALACIEGVGLLVGQKLRIPHIVGADVGAIIGGCDDDFDDGCSLSHPVEVSLDTAGAQADSEDQYEPILEALYIQIKSWYAEERWKSEWDETWFLKIF